MHAGLKKLGRKNSRKLGVKITKEDYSIYKAQDIKVRRQ
jgi:hypothetical protein